MVFVVVEVAEQHDIGVGPLDDFRHGRGCLVAGLGQVLGQPAGVPAAE